MTAFLFGSFGLPELASSHGAEVDFVIVLTHILMFVLGLGWAVFFLYTLWRFRASKNPKADHTGITSKFNKYAEVGIIIFEAILLVCFSIPFWAQTVDAQPDNLDDAVRVKIIAQQFAWNAHFPGPDGVFGRTVPELVDDADNPLGIDPDDANGDDDIHTLNDLHLPVGEPVYIELTSKDVIHGFALQEMRVKQDAVPGQMTPIYFTPIKTGKWQISCAQLCGNGHYKMAGNFEVTTRAEFEAYLVENSDSDDEDYEDDEDEDEDEEDE